MTKEDVKWLKDFVNEIKTQDNMGTATPVFWGVMETHDYPTDEDHMDGQKVIDDEGNTMDLNDLKEFLLELDGSRGHRMEISKWNKDEISLYEYAVDNELFDVYNQNVRLVNYMNIDKLSTQSGAFLTKRSAEHHMSINAHNYKHGAHIYCMHAFRNYELVRLLNILCSLDFEELEKVANETE